MNKSILIQYLPLSHAKATLRVVRKLGNNGIKAIIDLEDSVQDPFCNDTTNNLKKNARKNFLDLITSKKFDEKVFKEPIFLRINSTDTDYFNDDIETLLEVFKTKFPLKGVFLPKVEDYSQVEQLHSLIKNKYSDLEIVPMIETVKGMNNLKNILKSDENLSLFKYVHYGHFDYALDAGFWPFPDPDHQVFWDIVLSMTKLVLDYKKIYIHTPFPFMDNNDLFWQASHFLEENFPNKEIWICTLNSELSLSDDNKESLSISNLTCSQEESLNQANLIKNDFLNGRANKRSFSVGSNRFIPPHQYFAALKYLDKNSNN
jgi:citrate lyase beta subunit